MSPKNKLAHTDLQADIKVLLKENELLMERAEEITLLQSAGDALYASSDQKAIVQDVLERLSIFLDIPFCAFCVREGNTLFAKNVYTQVSNESQHENCIVFSTKLLNRTDKSPQFNTYADLYADGFRIEIAGATFEPRNIAIFRTSSVDLPTLVFVFADKSGRIDSLSNRQKVIRAVLYKIVSRLDNLTLSSKLERLNAELEDRVRQRTAESLESELRYRGLFESSIDGICTLDAEGNFIDVNQAAVDLMGYPKADLLKMAVQDLVVAEDREKSTHYMEKLREDGFYQGYEGRVVTQAGEIRHIQVSSIARYENGVMIGSHDILRDVSERVLSERKLTANLAEKEVLLQEIQHRTRNNMMVIIALLNMQARAAQNPELALAFKVTQDRIYAMSLVYDHLQKSDNFAAIDLKQYVTSLSQKLHTSGLVNPGRIRFVLECESIPIPLTQAVPIGIVLNETITNALHHGFPDNRSGEITVVARIKKPGRLTILVSDNGVGISADLMNKKGDSLGLRIVDMLIGDQLAGEHSMKSDMGVSHFIEFDLQ